jgi:hypothetical protein
MENKYGIEELSNVFQILEIVDRCELNRQEMSYPNSSATEEKHGTHQTEDQKEKCMLEMLHLKQKAISIPQILENRI